MKLRHALKAVILSATVLAGPANAALVYVTCQFTSQGKPEVRKFTLNEEIGKVSIFYPETAESQTVEAGFTSDTVIFETYVDLSRDNQNENARQSR